MKFMTMVKIMDKKDIKLQKLRYCLQYKGRGNLQW